MWRRESKKNMTIDDYATIREALAHLRYSNEQAIKEQP